MKNINNLNFKYILKNTHIERIKIQNYFQLETYIIGHFNGAH